MNEDQTRLWAPGTGGGTTGLSASSNAVKFAPLRLLQSARTLLEAQVQEQERDAAAALIEVMRAGDQERTHVRLVGALDQWYAIEEIRALLKEVETEIRKRETAEPGKRGEVLGHRGNSQ